MGGLRILVELHQEWSMHHTQPAKQAFYTENHAVATKCFITISILDNSLDGSWLGVMFINENSHSLDS